MNLDKRVQIMDFVDDTELISLYKEAFCVIFMPYKEPFGMVALESMAAGTPVIGLKNGGGYTELIKEEINGFIVENNPQDIVQKINLIKNDEILYKKMSQNCRKTANKHTWDDTSRQLMTIFENYLNKN